MKIENPPSWTAAYMLYAKTRPHARFDLGVSNVLPCSMDDLRGAREAVEVTGENDNGYPPLVDAIASRYGVDGGRVATAVGTSGANFLVYLGLLRAGDEVLVEQPAYDPLLAIARALGAAVKRFPRPLDRDCQIDPADVRRAISDRTRLIVITNPHNPTGALVDDDTIAELARIADDRGAALLVDEVYLDAARGAGSRPAALLGDNVISTNSLTKSYGLAGLRCGWAIASPDVVERVRRARDIVDGTGAIPAERLSAVAFAHLTRLGDRARAILQPNLDTYRHFLEHTPSLSGAAHLGTVAFPAVAGTDDTTALVERLQADYDTGVIPGRFFESPRHIRIGLGVAPETLVEGLNRIAQALGTQLT